MRPVSFSHPRSCVSVLVCVLSLVATPAHAALRFVALGDVGTGSEDARRVADAAKEACERAGGCDFGVLLGDNVYNSGVASADDPAWEAKLEGTLKRVGVPFYAVLGNHDYGAPKEVPFLGGLGFDPRRALAQVERGRRSTLFRMPDRYWRIEHWLDLDDVQRRMTRALRVWDETSTKPWRIALGHHPYRSNGPHGDAGSYQGPLGLFAPGRTLARFLDARVLGRFDAYLSGHDHSLQDLGSVQGTELFISGAGAKTTQLTSRHDVEWQSASLGFLLVEAEPDALRFSFITLEGEAGTRWRVAHARTLTKPHPIHDRRTLSPANSAEDRAPLPSELGR